VIPVTNLTNSGKNKLPASSNADWASTSETFNTNHKFKL
jgi:hypothetical protein